MKPLEAWNKLDHTLCLNGPALIFNIDDEKLYGTEFEGEYDPNNTDCKSMDEMVDCMNVIEEALKEYEGAKSHIDALNRERVENALIIKAFEIIKGIDKNALLQFISVCVKDQEEYELLKEVLE